MTTEIAAFPIIRKRDGRLTKFDKSKITQAIGKAFYAVGMQKEGLCEELADKVVAELVHSIAGTVPQVEEIQDVVERVLIREGYAETAKAYILYRAKRTSIREGRSELMDTVEDILSETAKQKPYHFHSASAKMLRIAESASRNFYLSRLIPSQFAEAHRKGDIHIHDLEYYGKTVDSVQIPLGKLLKKGFYAGYGYLRPPKRIGVACAQAAIVLQSCQNDTFGGQSFPDFDREIGEYGLQNFGDDEETVFQAMEGLVYNLNSMYSRVGAQVPLSSLNLGSDPSPWGRMVTRALLKALKRGLGKGETPLFPYVIFRVKDGINLKTGDANYDLFRLALEAAFQRMNPSFSFLDAPFNRSAETEPAYWGNSSRILEDRFGVPRTAARGNLATVTLNLPRLALRISHRRKDFLLSSFYGELDRMLTLAAQVLMHRFEILSHLRVSELPFLIGEGVYLGSEDLAADEPVEKALRNATLSLGFIGLAETLMVLSGRHHGEDRDAQEIGLQIVEFMRSKADELSREHNLNFVLCAPPAANAQGRFAFLDRQEFGTLAHVTEKRYYTIGFAIPAGARLSPESIIESESPYHRFCNGGGATILHLKNRPADPEWMEKMVVKMARSGVGFGGFSFPIDECIDCGQDAVADGRCTSCGSLRIRKLRRPSAYLTTIERLTESQRQEMQDRFAAV